MKLLKLFEHIPTAFSLTSDNLASFVDDHIHKSIPDKLKSLVRGREIVESCDVTMLTPTEQEKMFQEMNEAVTKAINSIVIKYKN